MGWRTDEGPPSHSVPPHAWAKAARATGDPAAAEAFHRSLFEAYFSRHRDITSDTVLEELWTNAALGELPHDLARFEASIAAEHREAIEYGASGAPATRAEGSEYGVLMGAQPISVYRRWFDRLESAPGAISR